MINVRKKLYNVLKYCILIVFPALISFLGVVMNYLNYEHKDIVLAISTAFVTCLGTCFGISNYNYKKSKRSSNKKSM